MNPLVCTHPDTGKRMLYLGRRRNAYIAGLDLADSEALLNELWSYSVLPQFAWEHVWRVGDLVLWDNRCTMHRRDPFVCADRQRGKAASDRFVDWDGVLARRVRRACAVEPDLGPCLVVLFSRRSGKSTADCRGACDAAELAVEAL